MEANTTQRVTGNLKPIDWNHYSQNWPHLKGLQFPSIGRKPRIDLLTGLDYSELHRSLGELIGAEGSPTARLTPLGWTCVGPVKKEMQNEISMFTFHSDCQIEDVNDILKRFWEVENINDHKHLLTTEDKKVVEFMKEKTFYDDENQRYEVHVPWKQSKCSLTNNCEMAKKRLESTERKLGKNPELLNTYCGIIEKYENKGYITKVTDSDQTKWYLPHFPVVQMDKATTKVRLVFDASAKFKDLSLNDVIYPGPELQNELFSVLLRFRKQSVAILCDTEEMYLQA